MTGLIGNEAAYHAVRECDTLLLLGADFAWRQFYPEHAKIVQIDIDPTHLGRRHPVTRALVGDIKATLEALIPRLHKKTDSTFRDHFVKRHREVIASQKEKAVPKRRDTISGIYLTEVIDRMAADDALVAGDDGTPTVWMHRYFKATAQRPYSRQSLARLVWAIGALRISAARTISSCAPRQPDPP
jgi:pyruvate dehydrogenase (quinone)